MATKISHEEPPVYLGQEVAQDDCYRLEEPVGQLRCSEISEHVYIEPEVVVLPAQHGHRGRLRQSPPQRLERSEHVYEEAVDASFQVSDFSYTGDAIHCSLSQSGEVKNLSDYIADHVYKNPEPVSFPLRDVNDIRCRPGATTAETSFSVSPEWGREYVYEEPQPVVLQGEDHQTTQVDDEPTSFSNNKNSNVRTNNRKDKEKVTYAQILRVNSRCVARTTVAITILIITVAVLLLSDKSWQRQSQGPTDFLPKTTPTKVNVSFTMGVSGTLPYMSPYKPTKILSTSVQTSTAVTTTTTNFPPAIGTEEDSLWLETKKGSDCFQPPADERDESVPPAEHGYRFTFRLGGAGTREFSIPGGLVVSLSNKIFVTDMRHKTIQVFNMNGVQLRQFPTVVPGNRNVTMKPYDISMDNEGYFWVVGVTDEHVYWIVRYKEGGCIEIGFSIIKPGLLFRGIAVDRQRNHVIITGQYNARVMVVVLRQDGTVLHTFQTEQRGRFGPVTVDEDGTIFVVHPLSGFVHVFDSSIGFLFKFEGKTHNSRYAVTGICLTRSGNLIVVNGGNNGVEIHTRCGEFVRYVDTGVRFFHPYTATVGPDGQLLVTDRLFDSITIFTNY
uniref:Uncharacterized protein n=1 Tax=Branchiostoma floridae TaxID=7739 RepID=C3ZF18_BRAFL|eukprot:XP_002593313.1 hypothetical protein BRAFLDRAFT_83861 [Branchiostoma floridae]